MLSRQVKLAVLAVFVAACSAEIVNKNVDRTFSLKNQLVTVTTVVEAENLGSSAVSAYTVAHDSALADHLAILTAKVGKTEATVTGNSVAINIPAGKSKKITLIAVYTHAQVPFPASITQDENQKVKVTINQYFTSPYATKKQKTTFVLAGPVETYTKPKVYDISTDKKKISYGPFVDVEANAEASAVIHFENNTPFLTVTELVREIEVSHWGNVAITEDINVFHAGGKLKGPFSRFDYQRQPNSGRSSVKEFTTRLPAAAEDVYYRDIIGNISTSHFRKEKSAAILEVTPRFPLFGGWKTFYTVGYNLPTYEVLTSNGKDYELDVRFVDHIFDNMVIDRATIKVILPEGVEDVKTITPFGVDVEGEETRVTYLDTYGRNVIVLQKNNVVEGHMKNFKVQYKFNKVLMLREPAMLITFFLILFTVVIVYNRMEFAIDTTSIDYKSSQAKAQCAGKIDEIASIFNKQNRVYDSLQSETGDKKVLFSQLRENATQVESIASELKSLHADISIQVDELLQLEKKRRVTVETSLSAASTSKKGGTTTKIKASIKDLGDQIAAKLQSLS